MVGCMVMTGASDSSDSLAFEEFQTLDAFESSEDEAAEPAFVRFEEGLMTGLEPFVEAEKLTELLQE
eukprot:CAMPEP_0202950814 /NCGR_PEP_ID=MMETSP1395-20130829/25816_1 /ASSEMBLY_ACC=CAM_ASM_000871 /TAXON_ID=5961 /ORGANISM="Blepharisma japonicum, Strain Stock R1072" /LENGTH=66 /DNA_ID=CAMNT_0049656223 /DNA_START=268 /DNA_END=469 /DNA_ORIENTATION=-